MAKLHMGCATDLAGASPNPNTMATGINPIIRALRQTSLVIPYSSSRQMSRPVQRQMPNGKRPDANPRTPNAERRTPTLWPEHGRFQVTAKLPYASFCVQYL